MPENAVLHRNAEGMPRSMKRSFHRLDDHAATPRPGASGNLAIGTVSRPVPARWAAACGLIVAAVFFAYAGAFDYPFLFDGLPLAEHLRTLRLFAPTDWLLPRPRTFGYFTFEVQNSLHGMWLPGYHIVNVAIHTAAACLLGAIVHGTLGRCAPDFPPWQRDAAAFFAALLFGLHPLATHAVTYLYQRFESLMGLLFFGAIWSLLRSTEPGARTGRWLAASYACFVLGMATKEVAVMAPLVLLLFDRSFLAGSWSEIIERRKVYYTALFGTIVAGLVYVLANWSHYAAGGLLVAHRVSVWQYLRTQPEIVGHYLRQAIWPDHLSIDPAWPVQDDLRRLAVSWLLVAAAAAGTAWLWRADKRLAFLPLAFALPLAPTSTIAPVIDLAFEHRVYLSLAPLAVAVTLAASMLARQSVKMLGSHDSAAKWLTGALLLAITSTLGATTFSRNRVHASPVALWADTVLKSPHNTRAWANLGTALEESGDPRALKCYEEIVSLYRGAAGRKPHPLADVARRTPRTIEYVWYGFARLATLTADDGDFATARRLFEELERLPCLPQGGLDRVEIKSLRNRLAARKAG